MPPENDPTTLDPSVLDSEAFKNAVSTAVASAVTTATAPLQTSLSNVEANNANLVAEKRQLEADHSEFKKKFEGIDVEALQARLAEVDNDETKAMLARGEFEKVYEKETATLQANHQSELEQVSAGMAAKDTEITNRDELIKVLQGSLVTRVRDGGISDAFVSSAADKSQLISAQAIAQMTVMVADEKLPVIAVDNAGNSVFRNRTTGVVLQNATGDFGYPDWLVHLSEVEGLPIYSKPNSHSNPNAITDKNPKGFVKSKMTDAEKQQYKKEHGITAYDALPFD